MNIGHHPYALKRTVRIVLSVIVTLIICILLSVSVLRVFTVKNLIVDAPGMSIELEKSMFGQNLLFLPTEKLKADLLSGYPLLDTVTFEKKYPSTLIVHLTKKTESVVLLSGGIWYLVNDSGTVVGAAPGTISGLPVVDIPVGTWSIGSSIRDERVKTALDFIRLTRRFLVTERISVRDSTSLLVLSGKTSIFIPQAGAMQPKADTLQVIVEGFRIKGTLPTVIDLRFGKPVITN